MVKAILTQKLIEKGILKPETEIEATYEALDLSGIHRAVVSGPFIVTGIRQDVTTKEPIFLVSSTINGRRERIRSESIRKIDGMEPARLASIYNISPDGNDKPAGKRRGRKPKVKL